MSIGSIPQAGGPSNYERLKVRVNGTLLNNTPRYINLGNGLSVSEDVLNDRLDIAVTNVLTTNSVATAMIQDNAITNPKLADNAVTAAEIASDAVTTAKILDDNVTSAKIGDLTASSRPQQYYCSSRQKHDWYTS